MRKWKLSVDNHYWYEYFLRDHRHDKFNFKTHVFMIGADTYNISSDMLISTASPNFSHCHINLGFEI